MAESLTYPPEFADVETDEYAALISLYGGYKNDFDVMWLVQAGVLVFLMHLGFMTLEAGSVQMKNKNNIIFKNFLTVSISAVSYWALGFGLAYGAGGLEEGSLGDRLIGSGSFFTDAGSLDGASEIYPANGTFNQGGDAISVIGYGQGFFFFQWAFAATAATIVSGAVAGRMRLEAYFITALWITAFVYPVVTHWVWASHGWLTAFAAEGFPNLFSGDGYPESPGMLDFAGSAVVHMTGGVAAFWGAFFLGPRANYLEAKGHNLPLVFMGTMLLWFGWYGFNCGSTLVFANDLAGKTAVTTTLAPSSAVLFGMTYLKLTTGKWDLVNSLNCALAGLVSITANCSFVEDWAAVPIGAIGALLYILSSKAFKAKGIDDPVGAIAVHGVCGAWGALAVAIFGSVNAVDFAYGSSLSSFASTKNSGGEGYVFTPLPGYQFAIQLCGVLAIFAWVTLMTVPLFFVMKITGFIRVSEADESAGLDVSEHGANTTKQMSETILEEKP